MRTSWKNFNVGLNQNRTSLLSGPDSVTIVLALKYSDPEAMAHFEVMDSSVPIHCCFSLNEGHNRNRSLRNKSNSHLTHYYYGNNKFYDK